MTDVPPRFTQAVLNRKAAPKTAYKPSGVSATGRKSRSFAVRLWAVRQSRALEWFYERFANVFLMLHPMWKAVGYQRAEAPVKFVEKHVKGFLFDCRMCGQCVLSSTGMSCPMNCPKQLRNGPCGGVRANGNCEVEPDMPCVWVQAWSGAQKMEGQRQDFQRPEAGRPVAARNLVLAACDRQRRRRARRCRTVRPSQPGAAK
jgi:hypothetical protein